MEKKYQEKLKVLVENLKERDYEPYSQIVGYLITGDLTYITTHNNSRELVKSFEIEEVLIDLLKSYLEDE